jgi:Zn-dependent protease
MSGSAQEPPAKPAHEKPAHDEQAVSPLFQVLLAIFLALAALMLWRPSLARAAVFPFVLSGYLISICLHEFGHAVAAYYCGDRTVRAKGYLTLNPLRYTNLQYSIILPLLFVVIGGVALPGAAVYIDRRLLRRWQDAFVSAAGPIATAIVLGLLLLVLKMGKGALMGAPVLHASIAYLAMLQTMMLIFNLIPCPGLDGWGVVRYALPLALRNIGQRFAPIAPLILIAALFFVPDLSRSFWHAVFRICDGVGVDPRLAWLGFQLFQFWK